MNSFDNDLSFIKNSKKKNHFAEKDNIFCFNDFFEKNPLGFILIDKEQTIIKINIAGSNLLGFEPVILLNNKLSEIFSFNPDNKLFKAIEEVFLNKSQCTLNIKIKNNTSKTLQLNLSLYDKYCLIGLTDISQNVLEVQEEFFIKKDNPYAELHNVFINISDCLFILDKEWIVKEINENALKDMGIARHDILNKNYWKLFPIHEATIIGEYFQKSFAEKKSKQFDYHTVKDTWQEYNIYPTENYLYIFYKDISLRKKTEEALKKSELIYRAIGESIDFGIWICAPDGRNIYASDSFLNLVGQTQEEYSNFGWGKVLHPDDAERTIATWKQCVATGSFWDIELRYKGVDGKWHYILALGVPVRDDNGEIICWAGINLDINKQKKTEQALRESKNREQQRANDLETILNSIPTAVWITNNKYGTEIFGNTVANDVLRVSKNRNVSRKIKDNLDVKFFRNDKEISIKDMPLQMALRGEVSQNYDFEIRYENGETAYFLGNTAQLTDNGKVKGAIAAFTNISQQKKIEQSLKESEENYRLLFEFMPVGLEIIDTEGNILYGNEKYREYTGNVELSKNYAFKLVRKNGSKLPPEEYPTNRILKEKRFIGNIEFGIEQPGKILWLNAYATPMPNNREFLIAYDDITEKNEREKELQTITEQLQKLNKTKDKLFVIIAHDLRNPFTSLMGFSEVLINQLECYRSDEVKKYLGIIHDSAKQAYTLLENLLNWSRSQTGALHYKPEKIDIRSLAVSNVKVVHNMAVKKNIVISLHSDREEYVYADRNMIDTVMRNVLTNAIKFSYEGGRINITITRKDDNYFEIAVKDYGTGIEIENISKLFNINSKFTSLGTNNEKGSGLGLVLCKEFIERNKGTIYLHSEINKGTTTYFTLPAAT